MEVESEGFIKYDENGEKVSSIYIDIFYYIDSHLSYEESERDGDAHG